MIYEAKVCGLCRFAFCENNDMECYCSKHDYKKIDEDDEACPDFVDFSSFEIHKVAK
jgi:hypothetical protein